jgi:large subunit ribosomal protein L18
MSLTKLERRYRIKSRIRKIVSGTVERPRMNVYRSNKQISVQLIDDLNGVTLVAASSKDKSLADVAGTKSDKAGLVGKMIAEKALAAGITSVVFDRNGYLYHGRVKQLADAAREGGLKF